MIEYSNILARRQGKSRIAAMVLEEALNAGKRVIVVAPNGMVRHSRKGNLTLIENIPYKKPEPLIVYDDFRYD